MQVIHRLRMHLPSWERTPANVITLLRLIAGTVIAHGLFVYGWKECAFTVLISSILLDWADGWVARHTKVSDWGAFMDPVADKCIVNSALILIVRYFDYAWWCMVPLLAILAYDSCVMLMRCFDGDMKTSRTAKWKQGCQFFSVALLYFAIVSGERVALSPLHPLVPIEVPSYFSLTMLGALALWIALAWTAWSAIVYARAYEWQKIASLLPFHNMRL